MGCGGAASNAEKTGEVTQVTESTRISDVKQITNTHYSQCLFNKGEQVLRFPFLFPEYILLA